LHFTDETRKRTPSAITLMIWGYVATAGAFALMALAGLRGGDLGRVSGAWLVGCYVLLSLAEVLLAPLGVSLLTQLAPKHKAAQAVGLWFAGSAIGNGLAGALGLCWDRVDPRKAGGKRPAIVGERMRVVETEGSEELRAYTRELADRAEQVKKRAVDPSEDNMLKITHDGRVASVFNGVPSEMWPTNRVTKLDACAREVWDLYCHSDEASGVQLVFCDLFTPKAGSGEDAASLTSAEQFAQQRKLHRFPQHQTGQHEENGIRDDKQVRRALHGVVVRRVGMRQPAVPGRLQVGDEGARRQREELAA